MCVLVHYSSVQALFDRERVRRNSTCPGSKTIFGNGWNSYTCFYDHACFELFSDCCSDYTEKCGEQKSNGAQWPASMWKCIESFEVFPSCFPRTLGVWMIYKCPADTTFDDVEGEV